MRDTNHAHDIAPAGALGAGRREPLAWAERRLMLAVLEDALRVVLSARVGRSSDTWVRSELRWFMSEDRSHPFAFEVICDILDLDASWLRRRLRTDEPADGSLIRGGRARSIEWRCVNA